MNTEVSAQNFIFKDCSLGAIATGLQASSLVELRDKLAYVDEGCLYYHFWGARLNPRFIQPEHHNDFASWVHNRLHDHILAEKLSIIDPTEFNSLEALRQELIEVIENRLDDYEFVLWLRREDRFHFIRSVLIIYDSEIVITKPCELPDAIDKVPPSSIYFHFIDARTRTRERIDDFSLWLSTFGDQYVPLIKKIQAIDPYFASVSSLKEDLGKVIRTYFREEGGS